MYLNRIMIGLLPFCFYCLYPSLRSATLPLYREPCFIPPARCNEVCFLGVYDLLFWQVIIRHRYQSLSGFQYWGYSLPPYAPTALSCFDSGPIVKERFCIHPVSFCRSRPHEEGGADFNQQNVEMKSCHLIKAMSVPLKIKNNVKIVTY